MKLISKKSSEERIKKQNIAIYRQMLYINRHSFISNINIEYETIIPLIPNNITAFGNVQIASPMFKELPRNFHICGNLDIRHTNVNILPSSLYVGGALFCNNIPLSEKFTVNEIRNMCTIKGKIFV